MTVPKRTKASIEGLNKMIDWIAHQHNPKAMTILEIGSWAGSSAEVFAKRFGHVICIDPFEITKGTISERQNIKEAEKEFDKIVVKYNNVEKIRARAEMVINIFRDRSIDIIYIDGEHTYEAVIRDIQMSLLKCKYYIAGHDYWKKFPDVIIAVNKLFGKPDKVFPDSSWIYKIQRG